MKRIDKFELATCGLIRMTWFLHRAVNGWIVTSDSFFTSGDVSGCHVFSDMKGVASFLIQASGEGLARDAKGHFIKANSVAKSQRKGGAPLF